jgi:hypothetical protein
MSLRERFDELESIYTVASIATMLLGLAVTIIGVMVVDSLLMMLGGIVVVFYGPEVVDALWNNYLDELKEILVEAKAKAKR